jgi:hypothetical protein
VPQWWKHLPDSGFGGPTVEEGAEGRDVAGLMVSTVVTRCGDQPSRSDRCAADNEIT